MKVRVANAIAAAALLVGCAGAGVSRPGPATSDDSEENWKLGWATIPAGQDIRLRMSGLMWPEAGQRIANSAYLTRESKGRGQIILFAGQPAFRGASLGTARLLLNALVYGPGMGTELVVTP